MKLKACPFCKSTIIGTFVEEHLGTSYAMCGVCGACGPFKEYDDEAIEAWNKRA